MVIGPSHYPHDTHWDYIFLVTMGDIADSIEVLLILESVQTLLLVNFGMMELEVMGFEYEVEFCLLRYFLMVQAIDLCENHYCLVEKLLSIIDDTCKLDSDERFVYHNLHLV